MSGILYVCATPIGNLEDITLRVLRILKEVDFIAAEDTRHTQKLLNYFDIETKTTSYHEHNKVTKGPVIIQHLLNGENCALVTDAGMPGISDPGEDLIKLCYDNNINITVCPGASAAVTALVLSGLSSRTYCFEAFLPSDKKQKNIVLESFKNETRTIIFYESPHKLKNTLESLKEYISSERQIAVVREMTKRYEEVIKGNLSEIIEHFNTTEPRGEFVIIIQGEDSEKIKLENQNKWIETDLNDHMNIYLKQGLSEKDSMKRVAKDRGISKRDIYAKLKR